MSTNPQDPKFPGSPGEPNSAVEQEHSKEENTRPVQSSPAGPTETGDYVSEIRQSLASEEDNSIRHRTGSLIRRITGSLRRVTGTLREPEKRKGEREETAFEPEQAEDAEKTPTGRLDNEPGTEISDDLLTGRLGVEQVQEAADQEMRGDIPTGRLDSAKPEADALLTSRLSSEPLSEVSDELLTGRLSNEQAAETGKLLTGRLGNAPEAEAEEDKLLTGRLGHAPETEPSDDLLTGRLKKAEDREAPDHLITGRLSSEPQREVPDNLVPPALDAEPEAEMPDDLLTGRLGKAPEAEDTGDLLTGRLGRAPEQEVPDHLLTRPLEAEPEAEMPDDLLTGRLGQAPEVEEPDDLLTGRLGREPEPEVPENLFTPALEEEAEAEMPDDLLTGRLGQAPETEGTGDLLTGRLGREPEPEVPENLFTRPLEEETEQEMPDDLISGRLSSAPKQEIPDGLVTRALDEEAGLKTPDDLITGRLGYLPEEDTSDLITGRLGRAPEAEEPGDLITGRLDRAPEPEQEVPDNLFTRPLEEETEVELPEDFLTGSETKQETPEDVFAARGYEEPEAEMPDDLLTGRLGQAPEKEAPDSTPMGKQSGEPKQGFFGNLFARKPDEEPEPEITDDLLTGRLGLGDEMETPDTLASGGMDSGPTAGIPDSRLAGQAGGAQPDEYLPIPLQEIWGDLPDSGSEAAELLEMEEEPQPGANVEPEAILGDDEPINLLESGAIAALGMAEEAAALHDEDWMREIREEAQEAEQGIAQEAGLTGETGAETWTEQPPTEQPAPRSVTNPLRNFITGIFGKAGDKGRESEETEIPDEMVSGRLERSLGAEAGEKPVSDLGAEDLFAPSETLEMDRAAGENTVESPLSVAFGEEQTTDEASMLDSLAVQGKDDFIEGLQVRFGYDAEADEEVSGYELYPEDEALLWGGAAQQPTEATAPEIPISPEDIWGSEPGGSGFGPDIRREIWGEAAEPETPAQDIFAAAETPGLKPEDLYAATYLTGEDVLPPIAEETGQEELLGAVLSNAPETEEGASVEELRAIALEDYEEGDDDYSAYTYKIDWGDEEKTIPAEVEGVDIERVQLQEQQADAETRQALSTDWKSWFANRKTEHKILLVEAAVVVITLVAAIPFFLMMIFRGPAAPAANNQSIVVSDVPYPTGLTLPGGWYFPLERGTPTNGKWQPSTNEWLEGSELRRVIALPWNPQTEAVAKTFQLGDGIELYLSNNDRLKYRVYSIEQVAVSNTEIYNDNSPSLAIILYKENDPTRWVVICKP